MLIFEQSRSGRRGFGQAPSNDPEVNIPSELLRTSPPALPEVSELQAVRHYTRLSQMNYSI
ncbi:MAG: aminomethyl-transferring glycine dehydrogenase subunit GcvPB, partial [Pseudomonadota bacterium]